MSRASLREYFDQAHQTLGPQHWWPGDTPFEICVGAILTQNTNWRNVEKAINNLRSKNLLDPKRLYHCPIQELVSLIRPAGYFNIKAKRLHNFLKFLMEEYGGNLDQMFSERLETLREKLLMVRGIGPETADSILLYAGQKPTFVVDAYTKRILLRHELISEEADYHEMQDYFMRHLPSEVSLFNEFHALIVNVGKNWCKSKIANCEQCPWKKFLPHKNS